MYRSIGVIVLALFLFGHCVLAQDQVIIFMETDQPLDSVCQGSGHPLADGTPIYVFSDVNANGPDSTDPLARLCEDPPDCGGGAWGTVSANQFEVNGNSPVLGLGPGLFYTDPGLFAPMRSQGQDVLRLYLRICLPDRRLESQVIRLGEGGMDHEMTWTCVEAPYTGCLPPKNVQSFSAVPGCGSIELSWAYPEIPYRANNLILRRNDAHGQMEELARLAANQTTYSDSFPDQAWPSRIKYQLVSQNSCDTNSAITYSLTANGISGIRPTLNLEYFSASDDICGSVQLRVYCYSESGAPVDSLIVLRDGIRAAAASVSSSISNWITLWDVPPTYGRQHYDIHLWNRACGDTASGVSATGQARDCSPPLPTNFALRPNYPNPFNPSTRIEFDLPLTTQVLLTVFDVAGRSVAVLVDGEMKGGTQIVDFDAANLPSGVYLARLQSGSWMSTIKMVCIK
jgi:hypothetical protein